MIGHKQGEQNLWGIVVLLAIGAVILGAFTIGPAYAKDWAGISVQPNVRVMGEAATTKDSHGAICTTPVDGYNPDDDAQYDECLQVAGSTVKGASMQAAGWQSGQGIGVVVGLLFIAASGIVMTVSHGSSPKRKQQNN